MSFPKSTFMIFFLIEQISLFHVNVLIHELCFPSQMFSLRHKTQCPLPLYFPQSYYNRNQILTVFMNMVQIFLVITEDFTSNDSHRSKNVSPIMHVDGRISFDFSSFSFKFGQYFSAIFCKYCHLLS